MPNTRSVVTIVWVCFVIRGVFFASVFPLWEGFDEYSHFALIQYIATRGSLPDPLKADSSGEVAQSLRLAPVARTIVDYTPGMLSHDDYWRLSAENRARRAEELRGLSRELRTTEAEPFLPLYEAQQPPLYYSSMAPLYLLTSRFSFLSQVWILRYAGVLLASLVIPLAYLSAKRIFADRGHIVATVILIALLPGLMFSVFRVSNESLSIVMGALLLLAGIDILDAPPSLWRGALFGILLGLALLTKAYFLTVVPVAVLLFAWKVFQRVRWNGANGARDDGRKAALFESLAAIATCAAICGWWYLGNLFGGRTLSGNQVLAGAHVAWLPALLNTPWPAAFSFLSVTYIYDGTWSFLGVRAWMYWVVEAAFLAAAGGVAWEMLRPRSRTPARTYLAFAALLCVSFAAGICYHAAITYASAGHGFSLGNYLYALVAAESVLLIAGLTRWPGPRFRFLPVALLGLVLVVIETYGTWFVLLPYYAGTISHDASGRMPAFHIAQLSGGGFGTLFSNLAVNKAGVLAPAVLECLSAAYFVATIALLAMVWRLARTTTRTTEVSE